MDLFTRFFFFPALLSNCIFFQCRFTRNIWCCPDPAEQNPPFLKRVSPFLSPPSVWRLSTAVPPTPLSLSPFITHYFKNKFFLLQASGGGDCMFHTHHADPKFPLALLGYSRLSFFLGTGSFVVLPYGSLLGIEFVCRDCSNLMRVEFLFFLSDFSRLPLVTLPHLRSTLRGFLVLST